MTNQKIQCPNCNESISIDDALTHQIEDRIKKELSQENKSKEEEITKQKRELDDQKNKLVEEQKNIQIEINKKVAEKITTEKVVMWKQAQIEAENEKAGQVKLLEEQVKNQNEKLVEANTEALQARIDRQKLEEEKKNFDLEKAKQIEEERKKIEEEAYARAMKQSERDATKIKLQLEESEKEKEADKKMLQEQLAEKDTKLLAAKENEITLRKERNKFEEDRQNFELEKQRQMDEERKKISEEAGKKAAEEQQYNIAQLNKKLTDAAKVNDDLRRKLEQGSQQSQGEVLELQLEEILKAEFPYDDIVAVKKGASGADIVHKVIDKSERLCGQITWEFKKTKAWSDGWVQKLKEDQRAIKADLAVIVSAVLPEEVKGFAFRDGIWICDIKFVTALATALRLNLVSISHERTLSVGKNEKMEVLYTYLTGVEFKQRVEVIIEAFSSMDEGLRKERMYFEKIWSEREKQIRKVIANTVGMYGDLSGLVTLPQIKILELPEGNGQQTTSN